MTAAFDQTTSLMRQLISSCYQAQDGFRSAAEAVDDETLKRLLAIYAQQRTRFAEELRHYVPEETPGPWSSGPISGVSGREDREWLRSCLDTDAHTLTLYREALADRTLPTRAHFVISAQLSLMQRVHDRMRSLLGGTGIPLPSAKGAALESIPA